MGCNVEFKLYPGVGHQYTSDMIDDISTFFAQFKSGGDDGGGGDGGGGGGCFIATAAYGSSMQPHVKLLREFRDQFLVTNPVGRAIVDIYHAYSPPLADFISKHDSLSSMVRWSLLPIVGVSWMALNFSPCVTFALMGLLISLIGIIAVLTMRRMRLRRQA